MPVESDENFSYSSSWKDELNGTGVAVAGVVDNSAHPFSLSEATLQLEEHQYCLPGPAPDCRAARLMNEERRRTAVEPGFITYNHIARYNQSIIMQCFIFILPRCFFSTL